jgi:RNA polymerase primary sigma factor/RNA polymerase nonessential primary-like sigma factor
MTDIDDEMTLLTPSEVVSLQRQIEAGVLARAAREDGAGAGGATETELRLIEEQGERARQRFITANLRLVRMVARQIAIRSDLSEADLFQQGCLGLITAVARFDHTRGFRFSTYALFWIRAYVGGSAARHLGALNLPTSRAEQLRAARGMEAELAQRLHRPPTIAEVAEALGKAESWTAELLSHAEPQSLEIVDRTDLDRIQAEEATYQTGDLAGALRELLGCLDELSRRVLELRLGFADDEPRSYAHTARVLQISVNRVRRIEARALERLRELCPQQVSAHLAS